MTVESSDEPRKLEEASAIGNKLLRDRNIAEFLHRLAIYDILKSISTGQGLYANFSTLLLAYADQVSELALLVKKTPKNSRGRLYLKLLPNRNDGTIDMYFDQFGYYDESQSFTPYRPVTWSPPTQGIACVMGTRTFGNVFPNLRPEWLGPDNVILVRNTYTLLTPPRYEFIGNDRFFAKIDLPYFQDQLLAAIEDPTQWIPPASKTTL